ncbi:MAG TPA: asparagine synthase (glutamine-hydrolyzing) [Allosphingosinicella sp.]|jgi:asparagine synthase (glutamine-hydrolysing)
MCGIAAILSEDLGEAAVEARTLAIRRMVAAQTSRGPDAEGVYSHGPVTMGHNLLRILPCPNSTQPFTSSDGALTICYNGEIYNYLDLRADLIRQGVRFRSDTDTETILELYRRDGLDAFAKLRGMFALVLHDVRNGRVIAARDAMGQKALYMRPSADGLYLASTVAALRAGCSEPAEINRRALHFYLWTLMPPAEETMLTGIELLPRGQAAIFDAGGRLLRMTSFAGADGAGAVEDDLDRAGATLTALLAAAVGEQSEGVPRLATHLSGGLDSSAILSVLPASLRPDVTSYTCSYKVNSVDVPEEERGFEEAFVARRVADYVGVRNEVVLIGAEEYAANLFDVVATVDEPRGNPCLPHFFLARRVAERHRVVLSGEGADELFGGYPWKTRCAESPDGSAFLQAMAPAPVELLERSLDGRWADQADVRDYVLSSVAAPTRDERLRKILEFDQAHFLQYLLLQADKLGGRFSIEDRYPFLDRRIVDFARSLSPRLLSGGMANSKPVLRRALKNLVPDEVLTRPKMGFVAPEGSWYRHFLSPLLRDILLSPDSFVRTFYKTGAVEHILEDHFRGRANYRKLIWSLLTLEIWHRTVIRAEGAVDLQQEYRNGRAA